MSHKKQTMGSFQMLPHILSYSIIYGQTGRAGSFLLYLFLEGLCVLSFTVKEAKQREKYPAALLELIRKASFRLSLLLFTLLKLFLIEAGRISLELPINSSCGIVPP